MLAMHKAYEGEIGDKKEVLYVSDGGATKKYKGAQLATFMDKLKKGSSVLSTSSNPKDAALSALLGRGVQVMRAHWHSTGIPKGLPPEEIVQRFANLDESLLSAVIVNPAIIQLGHMVDARQALIEHRKADTLRLSAMARAAGIQDGDPLPKTLQIVADELNDDKRKVETPLDKAIAKLAAQIKECQYFNEAAGLADGWNTSALVVSELVDVRRFPTVGSLWHYSGQHVVDGKAPKRAKGSNIDWNPSLRTALYCLGTSIIKNRSNRWRGEYEQYVAAEMAVHGEKHPDCPTPQGHCGARGRRRIVKEILKEFWAMCNAGQIPRENQSANV